MFLPHIDKDAFVVHSLSMSPLSTRVQRCSGARHPGFVVHGSIFEPVRICTQEKCNFALENPSLEARLFRFLFGAVPLWGGVLPKGRLVEEGGLRAEGAAPPLITVYG